MRVVADPCFTLTLSKIAYNFRGGVTMDYLESVGVTRIKELSSHLKTISAELEAAAKKARR